MDREIIKMSASGMASPRPLKADLYLASSLCDGVEDNNLKQVTTLLKSKEADPNVLMPLHGITPFHLIIGNDSEAFAEEVTKLFLRYGGNPNVKSVDGMTPVHVAAAWGRIGILDLLLANGGDPLCLDCDGCSPFNYAFQGEHYDAVKVLSKYCVNDDEMDDSIKYKLELDKVLVNNGEVLAEYLVSDTSLNSSCKSASVASSDDRYLQGRSCGYAPDTCSSGTNSMNSDFVTVRRNQRKRAADERPVYACKEEAKKDKYDFRRDTVKEELDLLNEIISQMSNSLTSEVDLSNSTFKSYESECLSSCKTSSPKRMQMTMTFNRSTKCGSTGKFVHSQQNLDSNNVSNKTLQIIKRHNNVPKLKDSRIPTNNSRVTPTTVKRNLATVKKPSTVSSFRKVTPNRSNVHTPVKNAIMHSTKWLDETIISKSPNLHIAVSSSEKKKSNLPRVANLEKKATPPFTKINKKPSSITPKKVNGIRSPSKLNNKTPVSRIPRAKRCFTTPTSNLKTVIRKGTVAPKIVSATRKTQSAGKKSGYFSPLNVTYSLSGSSTVSSNYRSKNETERRRSLKGVAVNLSSRMDEPEDDEDSVEKEAPKKTNLELNKLPEGSEFMSGVRVLDSGITSKSEYTTNEDSPKVREQSADLNQAVVDSLTSAKSMSKLSDLDVVSKSRRDNDDQLDSMLVQQGSLTSLSSESFISASNANDALPDSEARNADNSYNNRVDKGNEEEEEIKSPALFDDSVSSSKKSDSGESYVSIEEEYKYEDPDEGVALLERRLCVSPTYASSSMSTSFYSVSTAKSEPLPRELYLLDNRTLRERLKSLGENPGPITNTTYHLYLKRLHRLESGARKPVKSIRHRVQSPDVQPDRSFDVACEKKHLRPSLLSIDWIQNIDDIEAIERKVFQEFVNPHPSRKWREGTSKSSFNYLLLDPRVTKDLPRRTANLSLSEKWETFLSAIFYVGKGKRSRPYEHLYDAFKMWVSKEDARSNNGKIQRILDIWNEGKGVVVLHVFHNTIPVEAYTREAAMIEVLGTNKLGNRKCGDYYGVVSTWRSKEKCELGRYMLFKAMHILLLEGERQIFPDNL